MTRIAEDLNALATEKKISNKGRFVKAAFNPSLDVSALIKNEEKIRDWLAKSYHLAKRYTHRLTTI